MGNKPSQSISPQKWFTWEDIYPLLYKDLTEVIATLEQNRISPHQFFGALAVHYHDPKYREYVPQLRMLAYLIATHYGIQDEGHYFALLNTVYAHEMGSAPRIFDQESWGSWVNVKTCPCGRRINYDDILCIDCYERRKQEYQQWLPPFLLPELIENAYISSSDRGQQYVRTRNIQCQTCGNVDVYVIKSVDYIDEEDGEEVYRFDCPSCYLSYLRQE